MISELAHDQLRDPQLLSMGQHFFKESNLPGSFVPDVFIDTWSKIITRGIGRIWAARTGDLMTGAIGGLIHPDPYDGKMVVQEAFWFIDESHRGGITAIRLYASLERWAIHAGASRLCMSCTMNKYIAKLRHFNESQGYKPCDISYFKNL